MKKVYITIVLTVLFGLTIIIYSGNKAKKATENCKIICGEINYECRNHCFIYEYRNK